MSKTLNPSSLSQYLLLSLVVVMAAALAACGSGSGEPDLAVPDLAISTYQGEDVLGGAEVNLSDIVAQGKPVVLNYWAAQCPPCLAEMPDIQRVYDDRRDEITIVGIDIGPQQFLGSREEGRALLGELDITYPAGTTFNANVAREFEITSMPTTLFIRPDGSLHRKWAGLLSESKLREIIDEMVAS